MAVVALVVLRGSRSGDASARERDAARQAGCDVLQVLPHGVLVRGTETQLAQIEARDFRVEIFPDTEFVQAGKYRWRVDEPPPALEPELDIPPAQTAIWLHRLVHLIGPPIPEWISEIKARGATVIDNVGRYGLLISASPAVADQVAALPWVALVALYRPAFRIARSLFEQRGRIRYVAIMAYPKEAGTEVATRIEQTGGRVERKATRGPYASIVAELDAEAVRRIAQLPDVRSLSYLNPRIEPIDEVTCQILTGQVGQTGYPKWLADRNLSGKNVTIAFADTGISPHPDLGPGPGIGRYKAAVKFGQQSTAADTDALGHGTYVAGIAVGDGSTNEKDGAGFLLGQGIAPQADFVSLKIAFDNTLELLGAQDVGTWADEALNQNASIMCNAWQQTPIASDYDAVAALVDTIVRERSLPMITGAGNTANAGDPVTVPGVAKNAVTVGATGSGRPPVTLDDVWPTSGNGPAPDGRFLPTVVAPGRMVVSTLSKCGFPFTETVAGVTVQHPQHALGSTHVSVSGGAIVCDPLAGGVINRSGTSFAVAHVSGVSALLAQAWAQRFGGSPSPALLKAWLVNGADDLGQAACPAAAHTPGSAGCLHAPSNVAGWGRVSLGNMLTDARGARLFFDEPVTFTTPGDVFTERVTPIDAAQPMRVTLVWTDPPADPADLVALRHDLHLEVESASGVRFLGNVNFNGGLSAPALAGAQPDRINNVECVYVRGLSEIYTVRVFAPPSFDVNSPSQTFALIIENAQRAELAPPAAPTGLTIVMDRSGSMQGSGFADATVGSVGLLLDLLPASDEVAVVSVGTSATTEFDLAAIGDQAAKQTAVAAANAIALGGCTFIGDAIEQSKQQLARAVNARQAIVLLSDGFDNKGCQPLVAAKTSALAAVKAGAAIPVHACAIGPASDQALLEQMAAESGGRYYYSPSGTDLNEICGFIRAELNDVAVIVSDQFKSSTHTVTAPVERQATAVTFTVSWRDPTLTLVSTSPGTGEIRVRILDPEGRDVHLHATDVHTVGSAGHVNVSLDRPLHGEWRVVVSTATGKKTECTATVFVESPLRLEARLNAVRLNEGSMLEVVVPGTVLKRFGPRLTLKGSILAPVASASQILATFDKKLKPTSAADLIAKDGVPTKLARILALDRMLRTQGTSGVFKQAGRMLTFRTGKGPGGPQRVAKARLKTPGSYNLVVIAEGTTASGLAGKPSPVRRTLHQSILVVEGP